MTTERDLIQRMARELDLYRQMARDDCTSTHPFADEARTYLAQPEPEGLAKPPVVTLSALLCPAYEPGDGSADGAQLVGAQWWHPEMGCDSLQIVVDNARVLARWGRPAVEPEPKGPTDEELLKIAAATIEPCESRGIAIGEYEPENECAVEAYGSELIAFARAVLARWGK